MAGEFSWPKSPATQIKSPETVQKSPATGWSGVGQWRAADDGEGYSFAIPCWMKFITP